MTTNKPEEAMTDRGLLELAAKAAGINIFDWTPGGHPTTDGSYDGIWNPLTDDGDALRLAITLSIHISPRPDHIEARYFDGTAWSCFNEMRAIDRASTMAAARRAITRAAADIGRAMP